MYPVIIHIPHCSAFIPEEIKGNFLISQADLQHELLVMTDWYTDEIFVHPDVEYQKGTVSRLVFDPERFRDDSVEVMTKKGMGAVYTRTSDGRLLIQPSSLYKETILKNYYDAYHETFNKKVDGVLARYGKCLIIDGHSFPSTPLPYEEFQSPIRPDICIGVDSYFTPKALVFETVNLMSEHGLKCALNRPFSGSFVTSKHYNSMDSRVKSIMIEINRGLYIDERSGKKDQGFEQIAEIIHNLIVRLAELF